VHRAGSPAVDIALTIDIIVVAVLAAAGALLFWPQL
jgi:ABC-type phosphate transport system auxiliary subunit